MKNQKEIWERSYALIVDTLKNNELGDAYLILQGLELVGYENIEFWFQVVRMIKNEKGIEALVAYIDVMQQIGREKIAFVLSEIEDKNLDFQNAYEIFVLLLKESNRFSEEVFVSKAK